MHQLEKNRDKHMSLIIANLQAINIPQRDIECNVASFQHVDKNSPQSAFIAGACFFAILLTRDYFIDTETQIA
jgi:hypothetical protein